MIIVLSCLVLIVFTTVACSSINSHRQNAECNGLQGLVPNTNIPIPTEEQQYIDSTLSKIKKGQTREEVISILGKPDRDKLNKLNWWVEINGQKSRAGVYFSPFDDAAVEVLLDGGPCNFYYRNKL